MSPGNGPEELWDVLHMRARPAAAKDFDSRTPLEEDAGRGKDGSVTRHRSSECPIVRARVIHRRCAPANHVQLSTQGCTGTDGYGARAALVVHRLVAGS